MSKSKHESITEETFDLMAWVASGTVATRQVVIHNDTALVAEFEALDAECVAAGKAVADAGGDAPLSTVDTRSDIEARMAALHERWEASKAVWTVRALTYDEVDATCDPEQGGVADPPRPVPPPERGGQEAGERFMEKVNAWTKAKAAVERERRLHLISAAVTVIEGPRGRLVRDPGDGPIVTVEELRAMRARPHGEQWVRRLCDAVDAATEGDVEVPRPTLPGRSTTLPG